MLNIINISINIKDQARRTWTAIMLVPTSDPPSAPSTLPYNKIFATLKWVCSEMGNNYSQV